MKDLKTGGALIEVAPKHLTTAMEDVFVFECYSHWHADGTRCAVYNHINEATGVPLCSRPHPVHRLEWRDTIENLVVNVGLTHLMRIFRSTSTGGAAGGYHDYRRMPQKWVANTAYSAGDVVRPTESSGQIDNNRVFICIVAGTSANPTEPTWPNTALGTVTDNSVTWQDISVWYVGLVTGPGGGNTYAAGDTMGSHAGWSESTAYSESARQGYTPGSITNGSCDNSAAKAIFSINGTATIGGAFVCDFRTKSGTLGTLYGVGNFTGGDRAVQSGDTLNCTVTTSAAAA